MVVTAYALCCWRADVQKIRWTGLVAFMVDVILGIIFCLDLAIAQYPHDTICPRSLIPLEVAVDVMTAKLG